MKELTTSRPADDGSPPNIPGCELLRRIGRGSYGDVWLARDSSGEFRAVKVVYRKTFEHDRPFERELSGIQKFEPISRSHPSQVSILQVGRKLEDGFFYYVMELADDATWESSGPSDSGSKSRSDENFVRTYVPKTLKHVLTQRGHLSFRECLEVGLALATALEHLHRCGLIHRDIKPSNVIFADGIPKLADIGLVTDAGETISFVGTEGFLPPEGPGTPQADIYSLGKVLYEMSTGRDRMEFPELPTFVGEPAERESILELNQIFLRACQNDLRKRYQSAREMAHDLELLRSGRSVRQARATERRLAKARILTVVAIALIAAIAGVDHWLQQRRVRRVEAEKAQREHDARLASQVATDKSRQLAKLYLSNGRTLERQGDFFGALVWYAKAQAGHDVAAHKDQDDLVSTLFKKVPALTFLSVHTGGVHAVDLDATGQRILTAGNDGMIRLCRSDTREPMGQPLPHPQSVQRAYLSPDGERVLSIDRLGNARLWKGLTKLHVASVLEQHGPVFVGAFRSDGRQLLTVSADEALLRETSGERVRFNFKVAGRITAGLFSPDGRAVALGSEGGQVQLWNTENGQPTIQFQASPKPIQQLCFSPDSLRLAVVSGPELRLWNAVIGEAATFTCRHEGAIHSLTFSPDGRLVATAGEDRFVRLWETSGGRPVGQPLPHDEPVTAVAFNPDGLQLASAGGNEVRLWNLPDLQPRFPILIHNGAVSNLCFSREGHSLLVASADGTAREYSFAAFEESTSDSFDPREPRAEWIELMAGRRISEDEQLAPLPATELWQRWTTSRRQPHRRVDFAGWHESRANACENAGEWFAAAFHWECAADSSPAAAPFIERAKQAASRMTQARATEVRRPELSRQIPVRPDSASARLIDLSAHYNALLTETWLPAQGLTTANDLSGLPTGLQKFAGVEYDVRGVIQLSSAALENAAGRFPREIPGIQIGRASRRLHFLHGAAWTALFGTHVGSYIVHYANGETQEVKVVFGQHVREWWYSPTQPQMTAAAAIAWEGSNPASSALGMKVRLFQMAWINPLPNETIVCIDFRSKMQNAAPFLIALTLD